MKQTASDPVAAFRKKQFHRFAAQLALAAAIIALTAASFVFVGREVEGVRTARAERKNVIAGLDAITELAKDSAKADGILADLSKILPQTIDVPNSVIPAIKALAAVDRVSADVELGTLSSYANGSVSGISFSSRADGTLTDVAGFARDLEGMKGAINISSWRIETLGKGQYQISLSGVIFTQAPS